MFARCCYGWLWLLFVCGLLLIVFVVMCRVLVVVCVCCVCGLRMVVKLVC